MIACLNRFGGAVAGAFLWSFLASLCFGGFVVQPLAILGFSWMKYTLFASFIVHVRAATGCAVKPVKRGRWAHAKMRPW